MAPGTMQFWSLTGITPYEAVRELQLKLVELRAADRIPDTILFLEHEPTLTRGRGLQFTGKPRPRHMPVPSPLPGGMAFAESERGGDLTYHGPGQLVIYPICKLDGEGFGPRHDVAAFLRRMESVVIEELARHGLAGESRESATGVWVGERKIASMGIAIRKWVTYHGIAINWINDLRPFHLISPCGFSPEVMTRMSDLVGADSPVVNDGWRIALEGRIAASIAGEAPMIEMLTVDEAIAGLGELASDGVDAELGLAPGFVITTDTPIGAIEEVRELGLGFGAAGVGV